MEEQLVIKSGLEEILKKSSALMSQNGCHATSMRDLARATNMSLAGLYHYFKEKQDLVYLINHRGFASLLQLGQELESKKLPADKKLYRLVSFHIDYFCAHRDEMRVMMFGTHEMDKLRAKKIRSLKEDYRLISRQIIKDVFEQTNGGAKLGPKELDRKTFLFFGMMNWT